jgi:hypothetical protein
MSYPLVLRHVRIAQFSPISFTTPDIYHGGLPNQGQVKQMPLQQKVKYS